MIARSVLLVLVLLLSVGCSWSLPPTASFESPAYRARSIAATAWLKKVKVTDQGWAHPESRTLIENALTNNLVRLIRETNYFRQVELLPGTVQPDDRVLQFEFTRYRQVRKTGGFRYYDVSDLAGVLMVSDAKGQTIKTVDTEVQEQHPVGRGGQDDIFPSGTRARTQLIEKLLWKALSESIPSP